MLKNYLKIAFRHILRNRFFSLINITGLAIGISCASMIYLFVEYETGFDRFHKKADHIYRVVKEQTHANGIDYEAETPFPLIAALRIDQPDLVCTRFFNRNSAEVNIGDQVYNELNVMFVDSVFFSIFDFTLVKGSPEHALQDPHSVLLTESLANKYFPGQDPIGKVIRLQHQFDVKVTGVLKDPPARSSIPFSMILPLNFLNREFLGFDHDRWNLTSSGFQAFVLLPPQLNPDTFNTQLMHTCMKYMKGRQAESNIFYLQPLERVHYDPRYGSLANSYTTSTRILWIFSLIGLLIVGVAVINFINLATAQALRRSREVGVRKTMGAARSQLYIQFMIETMLLTAAAILLAVILTEIFIPQLNQFMGRNYRLGIYHSPGFGWFILSVFLLVSFFTGFYPATVMSGFNPIKAIRGQGKPRHGKRFGTRSILVVFQFVISVILLISVLIIAMQTRFLKQKDLGFISKNRIILELPRADITDLRQFKTALLKWPEITHVSFGIGPPTSGSNMTSNFSVPGEETADEMRLNVKAADTSYLRTNGLKLISGRWYDVPRQGDSIRDIVVNEKLVSMIGLNHPEQAIGKHIYIGTDDRRIVGVVRNFHIYSLYDPITPMAFIYEENLFRRGIVGFVPGTEQQAIAHIESAWKTYFPNTFIEHENYRERLSGRYINETKIFETVLFFSVIAILIGCLGLFGLVSVMVVQRSREIGIRKVLGARRPQIIGMLVRIFLQWIVAANLIAWPVAYYVTTRWLENFSYRIAYQWWVFPVAAGISIFIAVLSILYHALKAASVNPAETVKYE